MKVKRSPVTPFYTANSNFPVSSLKGHRDFLMSEIQFYDTGYQIANNEFSD